MSEQLEDINHYEVLTELNGSASFVPNPEAFDCKMCFTKIKPYQGVILRGCLHTFCQPCLEQFISLSEDLAVKCPFIGENYRCESDIQEMDIKSLVSSEIYQKYLSRTIVLVERQTKNSYHCKTPNCFGWCIIEGELDKFQCMVCSKENCIKCEEIHTGMSCKEYETIKSRDEPTEKELLNKLNSSAAMVCPQCKAFIEKNSGCDLITCSMCKTELCWATKGLRWGSGGKGDTTGGCRCNVNGIKCHPSCNNCH